MDAADSVNSTPNPDDSGNSSSSSYEMAGADMGVRVALVTLYSLSGFISLWGNALVIVSLIYGTHMRNAIAPYIFNLAVADIGVAIFCIPFSFTQMMLERWIFPSLLCPISFFVQVFAVTLSSLTLVAISIDRYFIVKYPFETRVEMRTRKKMTLLGIWMFSLMVGCVELIVAKERQLSGINAVVCEEHWPSERYRMIYTVGLFLVTYMAPLILLAITYFKIARILSRRFAFFEQNEIDDNSKLPYDLKLLQESRKVVITIRLIVILFAVSWLPLNLFNLMVDFVPHFVPDLTDPTAKTTFLIFYYCAHYLAMSNSFMNPIIYSFTSRAFLDDVKMLYRRICCFMRHSDSPVMPPVPMLGVAVPQPLTDRTLLMPLGATDEHVAVRPV